MNESNCFLTQKWVKIYFFPYSFFNTTFSKSLKVRYINQIDISKILFIPCPIFQELKSLCFLRKLKDCLLYSEAGWFFGSILLGLGGGWFACLIAADKAKRPLCACLQAVCELQWNSEQVKQHIICVADVLITALLLLWTSWAATMKQRWQVYAFTGGGI